MRRERAARPRRREALIVGAVRIGLFSCWAVVALLVLTLWIPVSPADFTVAQKLNRSILVPEGWGFFTRDAREPQLRVYAAIDGNWRSITRTHSSAHYFFGVRKDARAEGIELANLLAEVPESAWAPCDGSAPACGARTSTTRVVNASLIRRMCGSLLVESRPPTPWAWAAYGEGARLPGRIARLEADCGLDALGAGGRPE